MYTRSGTTTPTRAVNIPVTITHAGGTAKIMLNQQKGGYDLRLLDTWEFYKGTSGNLLIETSGTEGYVIADAVRFVKKAPCTSDRHPSKSGINGLSERSHFQFFLNRSVWISLAATTRLRKWVMLVERSKRRGATQEDRQRPKKVDRYALGKRVYDQTDGCGYPLYGRMRDGKPEYMCGRYMKSRRTECNSNSVDGVQLTRFTLATLREQVSRIGGREAVRQRIEELAGGETEPAVDPNQLPVRKVARGIIALGDFPLPVPPYGEPRVLPAAALDAGLQRRLAAELEAAGQPGAIAHAIE